MTPAEELANAKTTIASLAELCAAQQRVIQELAHPLTETKRPSSWDEMLFFKKPDLLVVPVWYKRIFEDVLRSADAISRNQPAEYVAVKVSNMLRVGDYVETLTVRINHLQEERAAHVTGIKVPSGN